MDCLFTFLNSCLNVYAILWIFWVRDLIKVPLGGNTHTHTPITTISTNIIQLRSVNLTYLLSLPLGRLLGVFNVM